MSKLNYLFNFILDNSFHLFIKNDRNILFNKETYINTILTKFIPYKRYIIQSKDIFYSEEFYFLKGLKNKDNIINLKHIIRIALLISVYKAISHKTNNTENLRKINEYRYFDLRNYISNNDLELLSSQIDDETFEFIEMYITLNFVF
jgi:hypothetical protein